MDVKISRMTSHSALRLKDGFSCLQCFNSFILLINDLLSITCVIVECIGIFVYAERRSRHWSVASVPYDLLLREVGSDPGAGP